MLFQNPILIKPGQLYKIIDDALQISLKKASYYKYTYPASSIGAIPARRGNYPLPQFLQNFKIQQGKIDWQDWYFNSGYHLNPTLHACKPD